MTHTIPANTNDHGFKWYGGVDNVAMLTGDGILTVSQRVTTPAITLGANDLQTTLNDPQTAISTLQTTADSQGTTISPLQTTLNNKANSASPSFTGTLTTLAITLGGTDLQTTLKYSTGEPHIRKQTFWDPFLLHEVCNSPCRWRPSCG